MTTTQKHTCAICQVTETDINLLADCSACGVFFHLNPRNDIEGVDCGDVWAGDCDQPVLQFFCNPCLGQIRDQIQAQGIATSPGSFDPFGAPPGAITSSPTSPPQQEVPPQQPRRRFRRIDGP